MDWTSVFVEDGNEDLIIPQLIERRVASGAAPRLGRLVSKRFLSSSSSIIMTNQQQEVIVEKYHRR